MNHKRTTISIVLATLMLVSLFAVVSSAASVSGQTMPGTGPAAASSSSTGQWYIFAVDSSGALQYTLYGNSSTWNSLGGVCTSSPAAVSWSSTSLRLDVFVRGTDGALWHKYYQNGWSGWESLGGQLASGTGPAVSSWSAGRLDVFVQGTDGALWHKWWTGTTWSGWQSLGGKLTSSPAATWDVGATPTNNIHVFVRGSDGAVWQKYWTGSAWSTWKSLGGQLAPNTGPAVSQDLILVVQGTDHRLWLNDVASASGWYRYSYAPPEALSASSPGAVLLVTDNTLACVSDTSGNVWYNTNDPLWASAGSPP